MIQDIFENRGHLWEKIQQDLTEHLSAIDEVKNDFDPNLVSVEGVSTASLKKMAEDLSLHFANGGKMGNFLFQPKIVKQYKHVHYKWSSTTIYQSNLKTTYKKIHAYAQTKYCI